MAITFDTVSGSHGLGLWVSAVCARVGNVTGYSLKLLCQPGCYDIYALLLLVTSIRGRKQRERIVWKEPSLQPGSRDRSLHGYQRVLSRSAESIKLLF